jgi:fructose-1,6-bisphosphatase/inositol monophosphatase family enzyme
MPDLAADAALAGDLVREAALLAARIRAEGLDIERKTSGSDIVTQADTAAERLIVQQLTAERPDDAIVGEEGTSRPGTSGRTWVIDPVDGTYNFAQGLDWWCTALALCERGADGDVPVLGAVRHEATATTYVGGRDVPPTRNGEPMAPLEDRPLASSCVATYLHPPYLGTLVGDAFARVVGRAATLRMLGSGTLDAMAVAEGRLHLVCQHSVPAWDWLPGAAILTALGGEVRHVEAAGRTWYLAGVPTAVAEAAEALLGLQGP